MLQLEPMLSQKTRPEYGEKPEFWSPGACRSPGASYELAWVSKETGNLFPRSSLCCMGGFGAILLCHQSKPVTQQLYWGFWPNIKKKTNHQLLLLCDHFLTTARVGRAGTTRTWIVHRKGVSQQLLPVETQTGGQSSCVPVLV